MRAGNLHQFQKAAAAFKKGSKIGMRDVRKPSSVVFSDHERY